MGAVMRGDDRLFRFRLLLFFPHARSELRKVSVNGGAIFDAWRPRSCLYLGIDFEFRAARVQDNTIFL